MLAEMVWYVGKQRRNESNGGSALNFRGRWGRCGFCSLWPRVGMKEVQLLLERAFERTPASEGRTAVTQA